MFKLTVTVSLSDLHIFTFTSLTTTQKNIRKKENASVQLHTPYKDNLTIIIFHLEEGH